MGLPLKHPWPTVALAVLLGAAALMWPAFVNRYPILFSDSGAFLAQTVVPLMIWDKPWIYGPFAWVFHHHVSLWGTVVAQAVITSHLLWVLARVAGGATPLRHVALCAGLALFTALPFSVAIIMPDVLTPVAVLGAALLGWGWRGLTTAERIWLVVLASVATASHLSNLPVVFAIAVLAVLLRAGWGVVGRAAIPLMGALALLLVSNMIGHGRPSISPNGSVFLLARLIADGPAARTIAARCPEAGWYLCDFAGRLPTDADEFLWDAASPMNRRPDGTDIFLGGVLLAPEARVIINETLRREPWTVARQGLENFVTQIFRTGIGDTLDNRHIQGAVRPRLVEGFAAGEPARFDGALQRREALVPVGRAVAWLYPPVLALGGIAVLAWWWRLHRAGDRRRLGLMLALLVGVAGNALAAGALSGPHPRYQARIAWLVPLAAVLFWRPARPEEAFRTAASPPTGRPAAPSR